jgi:hypothetical protein
MTLLDERVGKKPARRSGKRYPDKKKMISFLSRWYSDAKHLYDAAQGCIPEKKKGSHAIFNAW